MQGAEGAVVLGAPDPSPEGEVLYVTGLAHRHDADRDHPSLIAAACARRIVAPRLVTIERGPRHPEASRAVVPLGKPHVGNADPRTALRDGKLGRTHEKLHPQPLLAPLLAEFQILRWRAASAGEPSVETGAHQSFVVAEIRYRSYSEGRYELRAAQWARPL